MNIVEKDILLTGKEWKKKDFMFTACNGIAVCGVKGLAFLMWVV